MSTWFQPLVVVAWSKVAGREAIMRAVVGGRLLRGNELISAARAHGLLHAWTRRASTVRRALSGSDVGRASRPTQPFG